MAEIVTGVDTPTTLVVIANVRDTVAPGAMLTDAGTAATAGLLLASVTLAPADGAAASSVTVLELSGAEPPTTDPDVRLMEATPFGFIVRTAVTAFPRYEACRVTWVAALTEPVVIVNGAETDELAGTVTDAGTDATFGR